MKPLFEVRRQMAHVCFGLFLIAIYYQPLISPHYLGVLFIISCIFSYIAKKRNIPILHQFLRIFEREKHIKAFPGRGFLFFVLGAYLCLIFFKHTHALACIVILTLGDAFTNLIGYYFGKRVHILNKRKTIEGSIGGILVSIMGASFFVATIPAILASVMAMIFEAPQWKIGVFEVDDNVIIPLIAGGVLMVVA